MRTLRNILSLIIGCVLSGAIQGCSEKYVLEIPDNGFDVPDGMEKITILVPDYDGGAGKFRSRAFDTSEEGYMTNLYVVAIKYGDIGSEDVLPEDQRTVFTYSLNPVGERFKVGQNDYHLFNMALYPGKYRFGVIANADLYLSARATKISDFTKESQLQDIVLNFKEDTPLAPRHLPMVCVPEWVQYRTKKTETGADGKTTVKYVEKKGETEYNLVPIGGEEENIVIANMRFLCSKVRYTILFDKTPGGISQAYGSSWIRFNVDDQLKPWATNIRKQTRLWPESDADGIYDSNSPFITQHAQDGSTENSSWIISIDRFNWSSKEGANYPLSPSSQLSPWTGTTDEWIPQERKVWQGVVYLPENDGVETYTVNGETKVIPSTVLKFPYHLRENSLDETPEEEHSTDPKEIYLFGNLIEDKFDGTDTSGKYSSEKGEYLGLERNYFYDVVAKVVNPDVDEMDVRIFVTILQWHETDQTLDEDWLYNENEPGESNFNQNIKDWEYNGSTDSW